VRGLGKKLSFWTCSGRLIEESPLDSRFRGNDNFFLQGQHVIRILFLD